jgi:hypothetical protein
MKNYADRLRQLDFHDSTIQSIALRNEDFLDRHLSLVIDYYNWENNSEHSDHWTWRVLEIEVRHLVHIEFNVPNLVEDAFGILEVEFGELFDELVRDSIAQRDQSYFKYLREKELTDFLSMKFLINNFGESAVSSGAGYIWIAGFNARHTWIGEWTGRPTHIPAQ